jgi:hypothetical protein
MVAALGTMTTSMNINAFARSDDNSNSQASDDSSSQGTDDNSGGTDDNSQQVPGSDVPRTQLEKTALMVII